MIETLTGAYLLCLFFVTAVKPTVDSDLLKKSWAWFLCIPATYMLIHILKSGMVFKVSTSFLFYIRAWEQFSVWVFLVISLLLLLSNLFKSRKH